MANDAVSTVVHDDHDDIGALLHCRPELGHIEEEAAIARHDHHLAPARADRGPNAQLKPLPNPSAHGIDVVPLRVHGKKTMPPGVAADGDVPNPHGIGRHGRAQRRRK